MNSPNATIILTVFLMSKRFIISFFLGLMTMGPLAASVEAATCDQTFAPRIMRYGYQYDLYDRITNPNSYNQWLSNAWVEIEE